MALLTEMTFLLLRVEQLRTVARVLDRGRPVIAEWAMIKQLAYAHINLGPEHRARPRETLAIWAGGLPTPDLLVYLHADPATLQARITRRGRAMESCLTAAHLARLSHAYELALAATNCPPVLEVDAAAFDVFDDTQLADLAERITTMLVSKEPSMPEASTLPTPAVAPTTGPAYRRLLFAGPGQITLQRQPLGVPGAEQVLTESVISGISHGTEMTWFRGQAAALHKHWDPDTRVYHQGGARPQLSDRTRLRDRCAGGRHRVRCQRGAAGRPGLSGPATR